MDKQAKGFDLKASPLVSAAWVEEHLNDSEVRVVDVRWCSRYENGCGVSLDDYDGYCEGHIPGAVFVGMVGNLSDPHHAVPDMLAGPEQFSREMRRLGIGESTMVVTYDNMGFPLASARLWWALSYYGHDRVRVLDGGLREWTARGRPLSKDFPAVKAGTFTARPRPEWIASKADVLDALGGSETVIVDCLTPELYRGDGGSHLWGERPGHIPGAVNVPYLANIDPALATATSAERERLLASGRPFTFSSPEALSVLYNDAGVTPDRPVITYCGLGYAGACGLLVLKLLGYERARLYDGSWAEWSADHDLPVELGASHL